MRQMTESDRPRRHDQSSGLVPNATEWGMPRKSFLRALLAGATVLAPFTKTARAEARRPGVILNPSPTQTYAPTRIMAIRHAEKPVGQSNGIDGFGNPDSTSLIPQGWQRAGALVPLFGSSFGALPTPSYLFAPNIADSVTSRRPFETITPLAAALGITINAAPGAVTPGQYDAADYPAMVSAALTCPGVVLIAWEHEAIPLIGNTILGNATAVPQTWPSARFDIVWIFDLNPTTNVYTFNQAPQLLLQGDLPFPISH